MKTHRLDLKTKASIWLAIILWASAYIGIRAGLQGYSPGSVALLRYLIGSVCMLFLYWRLPSYHRLSPKQWLNVIFLGICGFAIYNIALNYGELTVTAGIASFIISQLPVLSTLLAIWFYQERLTNWGWTGTFICILGLLLIAIAKETGQNHSLVGVGFIMIATVVGSIYSVGQKNLLKTLHPIEFTAYAMWAGTAAMLVYLPRLLHELPQAPLTATAWVIYIGIFPGAMAYLLWSYVIVKTPLAQAASYLYLVPLFATAMGWIILGEIAMPLAILGGLVALIGALIVQRNVIKPS